MECGGHKNVWCMYFNLFFRYGSVSTFLAECGTCWCGLNLRLRLSIDVISDGFSLGLIGIFHSPVVMSFLPVNNRIPL